MRLGFTLTVERGGGRREYVTQESNRMWSACPNAGFWTLTASVWREWTPGDRQETRAVAQVRRDDAPGTGSEQKTQEEVKRFGANLTEERTMKIMGNLRLRWPERERRLE